jgi:hypothetical protein
MNIAWYLLLGIKESFIMKRSTWVWLGLFALLLLFFGDLILAFAGAILGLIFSLGIAGLVILAIAAFAFCMVLVIGGGVATACLIAFIAASSVLFSWFWPYLLVGLIIYLLVRKKPKPV